MAALVVAAVIATGRPAGAGEDAGTLDAFLDAFRGTLAPVASGLFESVRHDLAATARPLPERVRARLRPFFDGSRAEGVPLDPEILERARYVVDAPAARQLFALVPTRVAAITVGDVVAFARGEYRPDCVEGVALIAHELVHVAQYVTLGRERFLARYFLNETLQRQLGSGTIDAPDPATNALEVAAYCRQSMVCHALAGRAGLPSCRGDVTPMCPRCPARPQPR